MRATEGDKGIQEAEGMMGRKCLHDTRLKLLSCDSRGDKRLRLRLPGSDLSNVHLKRKVIFSFSGSSTFEVLWVVTQVLFGERLQVASGWKATYYS